MISTSNLCVNKEEEKRKLNNNRYVEKIKILTPRRGKHFLHRTYFLRNSERKKENIGPV